jgi:hypothetical protein
MASSQLHDPTAFPPGIKPLVSTALQVQWAPKVVWTPWNETCLVRFLTISVEILMTIMAVIRY